MFLSTQGFDGIDSFFNIAGASKNVKRDHESGNACQDCALENGFFPQLSSKIHENETRTGIESVEHGAAHVESQGQGIKDLKGTTLSEDGEALLVKFLHLADPNSLLTFHEGGSFQVDRVPDDQQRVDIHQNGPDQENRIRHPAVSEADVEQSPSFSKAVYAFLELIKSMESQPEADAVRNDQKAGKVDSASSGLQYIESFLRQIFSVYNRQDFAPSQQKTNFAESHPIQSLEDAIKQIPSADVSVKASEGFAEENAAAKLPFSGNEVAVQERVSVDMVIRESGDAASKWGDSSIGPAAEVVDKPTEASGAVDPANQTRENATRKGTVDTAAKTLKGLIQEYAEAGLDSMQSFETFREKIIAALNETILRFPLSQDALQSHGASTGEKVIPAESEILASLRGSESQVSRSSPGESEIKQAVNFFIERLFSVMQEGSERSHSKNNTPAGFFVEKTGGQKSQSAPGSSQNRQAVQSESGLIQSQTTASRVSPDTEFFSPSVFASETVEKQKQLKTQSKQTAAEEAEGNLKKILDSWTPQGREKIVLNEEKVDSGSKIFSQVNTDLKSAENASNSLARQSLDGIGAENRETVSSISNSFSQHHTVANSQENAAFSNHPIRQVQTPFGNFSQKAEDAVVKQVFGRLFNSVREGSNKVIINLHPPELGRVKVRIVSDEGGLKVNMQPQSYHVAGVLEKYLPNLQQSLDNQGVALSDLQVSVESGDRQLSHFQDQGFDPGSRQADREDAVEKKQESQSADDVSGQNVLAEGLSLRV